MSKMAEIHARLVQAAKADIRKAEEKKQAQMNQKELDHFEKVLKSLMEQRWADSKVDIFER